MHASPDQLKHYNMCRIAFYMLANNKKKMIGMIISASFAAFILMQQPSVYHGVMDRTVSPMEQIKPVDLWVMDPITETMEKPTRLNLMDIYRIRSLPGVLSAVPLYVTWHELEHFKTKQRLTWQIIGVDPSLDIGLPSAIMVGDRERIHQSNAIMIDGYSMQQLATDAKQTIQLGDTLGTGAYTWRVSSISKPMRTYAEIPRLFIASNHLMNLSDTPFFILVHVRPLFDIALVAQQIKALTGYDVLTPAQFSSRIKAYHRKKAPIIISFIVIAVVGFVIGLIIIWELFNNFILTHLHQFGMLKMLGVSNSLLIYMLLFQVSLIGIAGYFVGFLFTYFFCTVCQDTALPCHFTGFTAGLGAAGIVCIIVFSAYIGIRNVLRLDSIDLCRDLN